MDNHSAEQRKKNMSAVRSKDTDSELMLRKQLWSRGYRYRKNVKSIFGKPDIVFLSKKIAIFCDSEFWHGYNWNENGNPIKTNEKFWKKKLKVI